MSKTLRSYLNGKRVRAAFMSDRASNGSRLPEGKKRFEKARHAAYGLELAARLTKGR